MNFKGAFSVIFSKQIKIKKLLKSKKQSDVRLNRDRCELFSFVLFLPSCHLESKSNQYRE